MQAEIETRSPPPVAVYSFLDGDECPMLHHGIHLVKPISGMAGFACKYCHKSWVKKNGKIVSTWEAYHGMEKSS